VAAAAAPTVLSTSARESHPTATDGKTYCFQDIAGSKGTVVVFICNHCPYVKAMIDRLIADAQNAEGGRADGIGFGAICSNDAKSYPEDSFGNMRQFAKAMGCPFSTCTTKSNACRGLMAPSRPMASAMTASADLVPRSARRRSHHASTLQWAMRAGRGDARDSDRHDTRRPGATGRLLHQMESCLKLDALDVTVPCTSKCSPVSRS
jgi:hypothetical protein